MLWNTFCERCLSGSYQRKTNSKKWMAVGPTRGNTKHTIVWPEAFHCFGSSYTFTCMKCWLVESYLIFFCLSNKRWDFCILCFKKWPSNKVAGIFFSDFITSWWTIFNTRGAQWLRFEWWPSFWRVRACFKRRFNARLYLQFTLVGQAKINV